MTPYLDAIQHLYSAQADPEAAVPMKKYMRNQFEFLGIKTPATKALFKQLVANHGLPPLDQLDAIVRTLWSWPEREYQYLALNFLDKYQKQLTPDWVPLLEYLVTTKSWWDTVDAIANHNVGKLLQKYPEIRDRTLTPWRQSDHIWLRRTTILFQLGYKAETDVPLLWAIVAENQASDEFFIQKAIGWALREYSKTDADAVKALVAATQLAPLSRREALKWLNRKAQ
ncbi:DNA alkylation repair protein [Leptolyngbya iicbica]|uniref:DNA alkylation repair protein n=2 Tax=Cyanophyceae TaxID=3028117 RepID=A0A4Q7DZV4_9CYAN|nr:DNA alkylation repair protein [Leptolyngbya sp. LK]RZM74688.1 DNA alkylation repair protein [Leptolyngbya sp. LK]